ncbi:MAG: hypothetical protein HY290_05100, partial [Planctomycetia bacterium]|nr:hypothetical protein [Planctomycetia bacterium]
MLKPEIAAKQLEEKQFKEPDRRFLPEAADLPAHLKALAFVLLDRNPDGSERKSGDWQALQKWRLEAAAAIDDLSATDRLTLLRMFFPNVAEHVEAGWQLLKRAPYQTGSSRKSFRSPALAKSSHAQRLSWLDDLVELAKRYPADLLTAPALAAWAPYLQAR